MQLSDANCKIETVKSMIFMRWFSVLKIYFQKKKAKAINYRGSRNFWNEEFRQQVLTDNSKTTQIILFLINRF